MGGLFFCYHRPRYAYLPDPHTDLKKHNNPHGLSRAISPQKTFRLYPNCPSCYKTVTRCYRTVTRDVYCVTSGLLILTQASGKTHRPRSRKKTNPNPPPCPPKSRCRKGESHVRIASGQDPARIPGGSGQDENRHRPPIGYRAETIGSKDIRRRARGALPGVLHPNLFNQGVSYG